ncbi:unnamed protein product [Spirodela intermedia]|uniref:Uncharacterized protein n=1 Tax=Spirodela intermedia TaxID=51605 RepID=A0A7I8LKS0_SPIIN|nr:unnamed protein product [Spirodela intermedia]
MDRECEIDEILSYRSTAENQLQDFMLQKKDSGTGTSDVHNSQEKGQNDERSFTRLRGWLNWLSLGMLGVGGTADSSSFAGVVSDEIIKDIYEATDSHPLPAYSIGESSQRNNILSSLVKFDIDHFTMTISSRIGSQLIRLDCSHGEHASGNWKHPRSTYIRRGKLNVWKGHNKKKNKNFHRASPVAVITSLQSMKERLAGDDWGDQSAEGLIQVQISDGGLSSTNTPCFCAHIKAPPIGRTFDLSIEAVLQCIEISYDLDFLKYVLEFQSALGSVQFQNQRVMSSFNDFVQVNARVLSKAEYIFLTRKKVIWDVSVRDVNVKVPQICNGSESHIMAHCTVHLLDVHISPMVFGILSKLGSMKNEEVIEKGNELHAASTHSKGLNLSWYSASTELNHFNLYVDLEDDSDQSSMMKISGEGASKDRPSSYILCSSRSSALAESQSSHDEELRLNRSETARAGQCSLGDECFGFHYQAHKSGSTAHHNVVGLLQESYIRIFAHGNHSYDASSRSSLQDFLESDKINDKSSVSDNELHNYGLLGLSDSPFNQFPSTNTSSAGFSCGTGRPFFQSLPRKRSDYILNEESPTIRMADINKKPESIPGIGSNEDHACLNSESSDIFTADFNLREVRVHFHDSSSVLATLSCSSFGLSFSFEGVDSWDAFCQSDGLNLTSPWSTSSWSSPNVSELVWGPSSPTMSSTLNVHVKKFRNDAEFLLTETYIMLQRVSCILSPEFLAMVIGYFSLPDWTPQTKGFHAAEDEKFESAQSEYCHMGYRFEILDSSLIFPVENKDYCLQLGLPKLSGSFIPTIHSVGALRDVPADCVIPEINISDVLHLVDVSIRGASLAVVLLDDGRVRLMSGEHSCSRNVTLLSLLDADFWIRIPLGTAPEDEKNAVPTSIMVKADACNLVIEDEWFVRGLEAMGTSIDQLSIVVDESKNFKSDALQFIQLKRKLKETNAVTNLSAEIPIDIRICANALSLKLMRSASSELVAVVNTKVILSALLRTELVHKIDADIMHIILHSSLNSVVLLSFVSEDFSTSVMSINFARSDERGNELQLCIPALDIWLHLSDWTKVIDLVNACEGLSGGPSRSPLDCSPSESESQNDPEAPGILPSCAQTDTTREEVDLIVKSNKMVLSLHLPIEQMEKPMGTKEVSESLELWKNILGESMPSFQGLHSQYLTFTLHSRDTKLTVAAEIHGKPEKFCLTISDVKVETLDMNLLQEMIKISKDIRFATSGTDNWDMPLHLVFFHVHFTRLSLLLSDQRLRSCGSIFDITCKNMLVEGKTATKLSVESQLSVNYKNFQKVMWEPFIEPWSFRVELIQYVNSGFPSRPDTRDIFLSSQQELNLNITEPVVEAIFLLHRMANNTADTNGPYKCHESGGQLALEFSHNVLRKQAPYIICNETSLPFSFWVSYGPSNSESNSVMSMKQGNTVQPGFSVPIYVEEPPETHLPKKASYSSERLLERKMNPVAHHLISVQLDGTSNPSKPMSMDLVGISYFDINFSKSRATETAVVTDEEASLKGRDNESYITDPSSGLVVPVVFDVSMHCYSKMVRLYSTVLLLNATSKSLELRFDIPFGVSPKRLSMFKRKKILLLVDPSNHYLNNGQSMKTIFSSQILGPIQPGQEFPLPVHLAEAVGMRWRPVDSNYFWSEAHSLSKILSHENRLGFMRSFVCYPSFPKSDPFRCCISIEDRSVIYPYGSKGGSSLHINTTSDEAKISGQDMLNHGKSAKIFIRQVRLTTPLLVKNNLPSPLSLTIDSGGVITSICLSEVDAASIFQIDSTHDLEITFHLEAYNPVISKFPRAETFTAMAKLHETKFVTSDRLTFYPSKHNGPICVKVDKMMDAYCGAREICISVPFLVYNCTGLPLGIIDDDLQHKGHPHFIPCSYPLKGDENPSFGRHGISILTSGREMLTDPLGTSSNLGNLLNHHPMRSSKISEQRLFKTRSKHALAVDSPEDACDPSESAALDRIETTHAKFGCSGGRGSRPSSSANIKGMENEGKVKPFMYSPPSHLSENDLVVRLQKYSLQEHVTDDWNDTWSSPFSLVPAGGSTSVVIPQPGISDAFLVSVTSSQVSGDLTGMARAVIFQPRYVICNACCKHLYYKQKGTSDSHSVRLGVGQHSHLHWTDTTRDLLICIRFDERGGQWSGSFLPDCLGDAQVKVRNHVSGALDMVRVEIQNANMLINETKDVGVSTGNSGTYLILLSDDDSGFMPYRIDNFSMESLRIYQQKCETAEIMVHSYSSCQYAWDEPCCPHRLIVEVPGEHVLGTYNLDDVKEYPPVFLPSSSEKPERRFFVAVRAEGATKVLSIIDSRYHSLRDIDSLGTKGKRKLSQQEERNVDFSERMILHLPFIGISLINSSPQELVYATAKETTVTLMQSSDKQKMSFQMVSLQIDNQLPNAPYPILLSFDHDHGGSPSGLRNQDSILRIRMDDMMSASCEDTHESDLYFAASKWRKETSFVSFEYFNIRVAPLTIELEELVLLQFLAFLRSVSSSLENGILKNQHSELCTLEHDQGYKNHLPEDVDGEIYGMSMTSRQFHSYKEARFVERYTSPLPFVVPIGAPWQRISLLARHQKKIYIEAFELAPVSLTVSFSSNPWLMRKEDLLEAESFFHVRSIAFQRGLMALVDVEGVPFHLKELVLTNFMASRESIQEIVARHYTKQLLHEIYKVFGSAGLIGNPMGFARNVGIGIKDFLSVSSKGIVQSPTGLITGVAQGSKSLLGNTIYAMSSAASQFSKAVHKGIVALTFDEQVAGKMERQHNDHDSHAKGILNEFLEGLTGLLQSPIRGAEKHGLPGVVSGIVLGTAGLVARPMASILETTGKAAQSIRKRSSPHQSKRFRTRLPRPLARDLPLSPYSWEEAIGVSMLLEADSSRFKDEIFIKCRGLKQDGKFIIITERLVVIVLCSALVGLGKPGFLGVADVVWVIETEMTIDSIIHIDREAMVVNVVGSKVETLSRQKRNDGIMWNPPASVPLFQMSTELPDEETAEDVLQTLWSIKEQGDLRNRSVLVCLPSRKGKLASLFPSILLWTARGRDILSQSIRGSCKKESLLYPLLLSLSAHLDVTASLIRSPHDLLHLK